MTQQPGGVVVALQHTAEADLLARVVHQLGAGRDTSVVVDVTALTMAPLDGVDTIVAQVCAAAAAGQSQRWSLVARRLTARRILRQLCAGSAIGVYPDVDQALAAARFRVPDAAHGPGA